MELGRAADRRALQRGQREAHRLGLDVREVRVEGFHPALRAVHASTGRVLRVFGGMHMEDAKSCLYCQGKGLPAEGPGCPVGHDDFPF
ncbi:MAG TPA: hypothetical protein VIU64_06540 [Polyangia bacterium]